MAAELGPVPGTLENLSKAASQAGTAASQSVTTFGNAATGITGQVSDSASSIESFYSTAVARTTAFSSDITQAIKDGFPPGVIAQAIAAGPQQGFAVIDGLVKNFSPQLLAVSPPVTQLSKRRRRRRRYRWSSRKRPCRVGPSRSQASYLRPSSFSRSRPRTPWARPVQSIAAEMGTSVGQVQSIAHTYGIALPSASGAARLPPPVPGAFGPGTGVSHRDGGRGASAGRTTPDLMWDRAHGWSQLSEERWSCRIRVSQNFINGITGRGPLARTAGSGLGTAAHDGASATSQNSGPVGTSSSPTTSSTGSRENVGSARTAGAGHGIAANAGMGANKGERPLRAPRTPLRLSAASDPRRARLTTKAPPSPTLPRPDGSPGRR